MIFLAEYPEYFDYAVKSGLKMDQQVRTKDGRIVGIFEFYIEINNLEAHAINVSRASSAQSLLGKRPVIDLIQKENSPAKVQNTSSQVDVQSKSSGFLLLLSSNVSPKNIESHDTNISLEKEIEWKVLKGGIVYGSYSPNLMTAIRNRLLEEGPEVIRDYSKKHPFFLIRHDFFATMRSTLKDDFAAIATVYSANMDRAFNRFPKIRSELNNDVLYGTFLLESLRISNSKILEAFIDLPEEALTALIHKAVSYDLVFVIESVANSKTDVLGKQLLQGTSIYEHITSAAMHNLLLTLKITIPKNIMTASGAVPFFFYILIRTLSLLAWF